VGIYRHPFWRAILYIGFALASAFFASGSMAATQRVAVQVAFVESAEITVADPEGSGTSDQGLAIRSSPGREYTILTDPAGEDMTVAYQ
jgi:hypothetical protein